MSLEVSQQTEARLTEEARRQGITVDALLSRFIEQHAANAGAESRKTPELPLWPGSVIGSLQRRDIYNDVP
jgi:hypothetical protein